MLSMIMITAITVVALPHLRITTLSIVRTMTMAYALAALVVILGNTNGVLSLFNEAITVDQLGTYMVVSALIIVSLVLTLYNSQVITTTGTPYTLTLLVVIILVGAYYLAISSDMVTLAVSLEIQSFSLYALTALYRWREGATSAGLIYFILGAFSSGLVLLGLSIAYAYTGETVITQLTALTLLDTSGYMKTALIIILSGFLFKITAAPFHYWGPEVYDRVPTVITIFINIMPKFALLAIITRFSPVLASAGILSYLNMVVILSWAFGSIVGLVQTRIKRLLAYSTVSHVGWILAGVAIGSALGLGSFLFYFVQYSATTALSFLCLIGISYSIVLTGNSGKEVSDVEIISSINGLFTRSAIFTVIIAVTFFSAAGIPPMVGFYAKLSVMQAILYSSSPLYVAIGVISSVISAGFYLSVISAILFKGR